MSTITQYKPNKVSFWVLLVQIAAVVCIEGWLFYNKPAAQNADRIIKSSLLKAQEAFKTEKKTIVDATEYIYRDTKGDADKLSSFDLSEFQHFTFLVYQKDSLINWSSGSPSLNFVEKLHIKPGFSQLDINGKKYLSYLIRKENQVEFLCLRLLNDANSDALRNKQIYTITSDWLTNLDYPLQIRFNLDNDAKSAYQSDLFLNDDSVFAQLIAYPDSFSLLEYHWNSFQSNVRSLYTLLFVLISLIVFTYTSKQWRLSSRLLFRIPLFVILWILLVHSNVEYQIADILIQLGWNIKRSLSISLFRLHFHLIFFLILAYELMRACRIQKRFFGIDWYPRTIFLSAVFGAATYFSLSSIPASFLHLINIHEVDLLDPRLFPPLETLLFILGLSLSFGAGVVLSYLGNTFLINSEQDQESFVYPFHFAGFIVSHYLLIWTQKGYALEFHFPFGLLFLYAGIMTASGLSWRHPSFLNRISLIRKLLIGSFVLSLSLYIVINNRFEEIAQTDFENKANALAEDFSDYSTFPIKGATVYKHDQGNWPGNQYIAVYDSLLTLQASWNRNLLPFSESFKLPISSDEVNTLLTSENAAVQKSILFDGRFYWDRYLHADNGGLLIRGILPITPIQSHIFAFFRFFYITLFTLLIFLTIHSTFSNKAISLFDSKEKLQSRILDTYIIASLLFLIALVGTTGVIVSNEEKKSDQTLLNEKKEAIIKTINSDFYGKFDKPFLQFISDRFQVNLTLFHFNKQILHTQFGATNYAQTSKLLLDKPIIDALISNNKLEFEEWEADGLDTYGSVYIRPLTQVDPMQILHINMRKTNKGNYEQLLETVSYLIAVYVLIFSLFIILAFFISKYLANPLQHLLNGLKRISSGKLDTIVPVTTHDEIGELANAYNFMIYRLKDLQKELAEVEREAAWSEMARQVAHEIKNPLTPMKLSLQHLQRLVLTAEKNDEELKPNFERISKNLIQQIDSLSAIASDFSKFAKPLTDEFGQVSINQIIQDIDELYQHDSLIKINLDLSDSKLLIAGVADDLKRVLINLIKNAIEAMPNGGIIIIRTYPYKTHAFLEIADTGVGIPVAIQSQVFRPNFSTKTSGTGIGLAICKKVVDAHSGTIQFASVPGTGTTFTLSFPLVKE
ncbi:sensor histidine kinase [bacterium]|nr:MAG: sensor histidine kinase [bacterium]